MKRPLSLLIVVIGILLPSCSNDDLGPKFVPGNIIVGFEVGVTIRQAYDFAVLNANDIGYVHGLFYYSNLPNDSLNYVARSLVTAGFPDEGVRIGFSSNRIEIIMGYNIDEDKSTIPEWINLTENPELKFEDMQTHKSILLYIPEGTEKRWLKTHINNPLINYIELDYIK